MRLGDVLQRDQLTPGEALSDRSVPVMTENVLVSRLEADRFPRECDSVDVVSRMLCFFSLDPVRMLLHLFPVPLVSRECSAEVVSSTLDRLVSRVLFVRDILWRRLREVWQRVHKRRRTEESGGG